MGGEPNGNGTRSLGRFFFGNRSAHSGNPKKEAKAANKARANASTATAPERLPALFSPPRTSRVVADASQRPAERDSGSSGRTTVSPLLSPTCTGTPRVLDTAVSRRRSVAFGPDHCDDTYRDTSGSSFVSEAPRRQPLRACLSEPFDGRLALHHGPSTPSASTAHPHTHGHQPHQGMILSRRHSGGSSPARDESRPPSTSPVAPTGRLLLPALLSPVASHRRPTPVGDDDISPPPSPRLPPGPSPGSARRHRLDMLNKKKARRNRRPTSCSVSYTAPSKQDYEWQQFEQQLQLQLQLRQDVVPPVQQHANDDDNTAKVEEEEEEGNDDEEDGNTPPPSPPVVTKMVARSRQHTLDTTALIECDEPASRSLARRTRSMSPPAPRDGKTPVARTTSAMMLWRTPDPVVEDTEPIDERAAGADFSHRQKHRREWQPRAASANDH